MRLNSTSIKAVSAISLALILGLYQNCAPLSAEHSSSLGHALLREIPESGMESETVVPDGHLVQMDLVDDMILNEQVSEESSSRSVLSAVDGFKFYKTEKWDKGIIPVRFDNLISEYNQVLLMNTCAEIGQFSGLRCVRASSSTQRYLAVIGKGTAGVCRATLGMNKVSGGYMELRPECFDNIQVLRHELGHVLGLMHEHQRSDRDKYIQVDLNNVAPAYRYALEKQANGNTASSYDFYSIMHYNNSSFVAAGRPKPIKPMPGYEKFDLVMGIQSNFSTLDKQTIAKLYPKSLASKPPVFEEFPVVRINILRYHTGTSHFYSDNDFEGTALRHKYEGVAFVLSAKPIANAVDLWSCKIAGTQRSFWSTNRACEGQTLQRSLGKMSSKPTKAMPYPLYRCYNGKAHFMSINRGECVNNGFAIESILGYVTI